MDEQSGETVTVQSSANSVSAFVLPTFRAAESDGDRNAPQFAPLGDNNIAFSEKNCHSNLASSHDVQPCSLNASSTKSVIPCTSTEALTTISVVTTGSDGIFPTGGVFSMAGDNTFLAVPPPGNFHPASCSTTSAGLLEETHQSISQHSETNLNQNPSISKIQDEAKKRRGGWPKGKKRKKDCVDLNKPRTPMAGYVRFLNSRRAAVKAQHPNLPSSQITRLIGTEWNAMSASEKQAYHDEAEYDKKRYLEELVAYQQSDAYQAFLKRQQSKKLKDLGVENLEELDPSFLAGSYDEEVDSPELYCRVCNQHFSSEHNKKEHMLGRQHLHMVTQEFEKEANTMQKSKPATTEQMENMEKSHCDHEDESELPDGTKLTTLSDVMETLLQHNYDREMEIRELRKNLADYENQRTLLTKELDRLKKLVFEAEGSLNASKSLGSTLSNQLEDLRIVPSLFGVIL